VKTGVRIIGIQNVHKVLEQLPKRINRKLLNQTMRYALKPFISEVRSQAKAYSKKLGRAENFGILTKKEQPWGRKLRIPYIIAGPRTYNKKSGKAYWSFLFNILEYGAFRTSIIRGHRKGRKGEVRVLSFVNKSGERIYTRKMKGIKPHPILRPAADSTKRQVEVRFMRGLSKKTNEYLDKMIKKYY